jgi:hypothetical protein
MVGLPNHAAIELLAADVSGGSLWSRRLGAVRRQKPAGLAADAMPRRTNRELACIDREL